MPTLYFQLERSKRLNDGSHPIYLVVKFKEPAGERRFRYYTGRSAQSKDWIGRGNTKKVSARASGAGITNTRLGALRNGASSIFVNAQNLKVDVSFEYFKACFFEEVIGRPKLEKLKVVDISFLEHLDRFIENRRNIYQPATIKTYVTLKRSLERFEKECQFKLTFEAMDHLFISLYTKHLIEDTGVLNNTLAKRIATLKAFLSEMQKQKINLFNYFEEFEASRDLDTTVMYLTGQELMKLCEVAVQPESTEEHVRDVFCFACFTGLRFSDWGGLKRENLIKISQDGEEVAALKLTMFKVHKEVLIPLSEKATSIIFKYAGHAQRTGYLFPVYSNQETNRTLKTLAKKAEIVETVVEIKKSGAKRITHSNSKHTIISCHDARNTYATLYLEKGGRPEVLQKILGHSDIKQTMRYAKIVQHAVVSDFLRTEKRKVS